MGRPVDGSVVGALVDGDGDVVGGSVAIEITNHCFQLVSVVQWNLSYTDPMEPRLVCISEMSV